jgi:hypothetical protein
VLFKEIIINRAKDNEAESLKKPPSTELFIAIIETRLNKKRKYRFCFSKYCLEITLYNKKQKSDEIARKKKFRKEMKIGTK